LSARWVGDTGDHRWMDWIVTLVLRRARKRVKSSADSPASESSMANCMIALIQVTSPTLEKRACPRDFAAAVVPAGHRLGRDDADALPYLAPRLDPHQRVENLGGHDQRGRSDESAVASPRY
jgi:hypothetical protein